MNAEEYIKTEDTTEGNMNFVAEITNRILIESSLNSQKIFKCVFT